MPMFFCRVELRGNPPSDAYERLHAFMQAAGFYRNISDSASRKFQLPHAMYFVNGQYVLANVQDAALKAARQVQQDILVLTVQAADWSGYLITG